MGDDISSSKTSALRNKTLSTLNTPHLRSYPWVVSLAFTQLSLSAVLFSAVLWRVGLWHLLVLIIICHHMLPTCFQTSSSAIKAHLTWLIKWFIRQSEEHTCSLVETGFRRWWIAREGPYCTRGAPWVPKNDMVKREGWMEKPVGWHGWWLHEQNQNR